MPRSVRTVAVVLALVTVTAAPVLSAPSPDATAETRIEPLESGPPPWLTPSLRDRLLAGEEVPIEQVDGFPTGDPDPPPAPYRAIQPGSRLGYLLGWCTLNFVFRNTSTGQYAMGTAGHCIATGRTLGTFLVDVDDQNLRFVHLGDVVFKVAEGAARDFGLITVPADLKDRVYTGIRGVEGPCASRPGRTIGDPVAYHGHGVGVGAGGQNRYGALLNPQNPLVNWYAVAHAAAGGDSGSPIRYTADSMGSHRMAAAGILTHALGLSSLHPSPVVMGPTLPQIQSLIEEHDGGGWELASSPICDDLP